MKVLKFNEMTRTLVNRKIELIRDVFVELEDDGFNVKIVNGYSHQLYVGEYIFGYAMNKSSGVFSSNKLIYVYITPEHNENFTGEEYEKIQKYETYSKTMIPKWRGGVGGYRYYLMFFNK